MALVVGAAVLGAPGARASDADKGAAQVLFEQGKALVQDRRFAEACPKFAESLKLDPGIGTMLWLADCYENSGKSASAWAEFKEAAAAATLRGDNRAALAQRRAEELAPKLSKLVIVPPPERSSPGIEVHRDGVAIGAAEFGIPVPVNPGVHEIAASSPGKKTWTSAVTVVDKPGTISVVIPVLDDAPPEVAAKAPGPALDTTQSPPASWGPRQTVAGVTAGVGLVAIGIGSYFGLAAKSSYDDWVKSAGADSSSRSSASDQALASTILFTAGAAALVTGALVYFTAPKGSHSSIAVTPTVSPSGAGMVIQKVW
jgi:hypothetical protein